MTRTNLVDGDNQLGPLHPCEMLDGSRDTDGEVQLGGNNLSAGAEGQTEVKRISSDDQFAETKFS